VHYDEAVYLGRSMHVLQGLGPQDPASRFDHSQASTSSYDHPYFGQMFLAGIFKVIGYPNSFVNTSAKTDDTLHSIEMLYLVPRVLMGLLAVVDTFLVYKIAERRYNRNVAVIASVLFAVMPLSWLIRRIYLDTILLPFLLSSILFAIYYSRKDSKFYDKYGDSGDGDGDDRVGRFGDIGVVGGNSKTLIPILLSGIFLGLAIFTKIPAFTMIPVVGFLIFTNTNNKKRLKVLGLWFIPVILIPLIWPLYAAYNGQFHEWLDGVLWQGTERQASYLLGKENHLILGSLNSIFSMDPVLIILALAGVIFATVRKDFLFLLWIMPFLAFSYVVGWITYFHYILILPAFCIASARVMESILKRIRSKESIQKTILSFAMISGIVIFGLISTIMLITTNFFLSEFEVAAFTARDIQDNANQNNDITIISSPIYSWLFKYVFGDDHVFHTRDTSPIQTKKVLLITDTEYRYVLSKTEVEDKNQIQRLQKIYNNTDTIATFLDAGINYSYRKYPYTNIRECPVLYNIQVKTNYR
jgi:Dolichyl-phosphate-mannose-protein mannosyltransferase